MNHSYKTFISVGNCNQPFLRLLTIVRESILSLPKPILIQTGHAAFDTEGAECVNFVEMDNFGRIILEADVVILHGGAGSILHAIKSGKKPFVMPRRAKFGEHINDHQVPFVEMLSRLNKVFLFETADELKTLLSKVNKKETSGEVLATSISFDVIREVLDKYLKIQ